MSWSGRRIGTARQGLHSGEEPIVPGTETVTASWDVDLFSQYPSPTIARFDTLDGRRHDDRRRHAATMTVYVENGSEIPLVAGDYTHEYYLQTIIQLGAVEDDNDDPPFFGPGSFGAVQAKDLAIADGIEGSGDDFHQGILSDDILFSAEYDWTETPTCLEAMIGTEPLQLVVGGFSESWVSGPTTRPARCCSPAPRPCSTRGR